MTLSAQRDERRRRFVAGEAAGKRPKLRRRITQGPISCYIVPKTEDVHWVRRGQCVPRRDLDLYAHLARRSLRCSGLQTPRAALYFQLPVYDPCSHSSSLYHSLSIVLRLSSSFYPQSWRVPWRGNQYRYGLLSEILTQRRLRFCRFYWVQRSSKC